MTRPTARRVVRATPAEVAVAQLLVSLADDEHPVDEATRVIANAKPSEERQGEPTEDRVEAEPPKDRHEPSGVGSEEAAESTPLSGGGPALHGLMAAREMEAIGEMEAIDLSERGSQAKVRRWIARAVSHVLGVRLVSPEEYARWLEAERVWLHGERLQRREGEQVRRREREQVQQRDSGG